MVQIKLSVAFILAAAAIAPAIALPTVVVQPGKHIIHGDKTLTSARVVQNALVQNVKGSDSNLKVDTSSQLKKTQVVRSVDEYSTVNSESQRDVGGKPLSQHSNLKTKHSNFKSKHLMSERHRGDHPKKKLRHHSDHSDHHDDSEAYEDGHQLRYQHRHGDSTDRQYSKDSYRTKEDRFQEHDSYSNTESGDHIDHRHDDAVLRLSAREDNDILERRFRGHGPDGEFNNYRHNNMHSSFQRFGNEGHGWNTPQDSS